MHTLSSPRARLVDLLWQLKQAYDQHSDNSGVRFIHFNTLLNDDVYRQEIVDRAVASSDRRIRDIGIQLRGLNRDGILLHKRSSGQPAGIPMMLNPDIVETVGRHSGDGGASRARNAWLLAGVLLLMLIGASGWLYRDTLIAVTVGDTRISGSLQGDQVWHANQRLLLDGLVFVEPGNSLTIEAGTTIRALPGSALIISRGAQLFARGQQDKPVVFTSAQPLGTRRPGDWGGVVMLGAAPINRANATIEGLPDGDQRGVFGGDDAHGSCGVLEYTRIEFAGHEISRDNELNGLTLGGCGDGTIVRHVQVHRGLDDGIEIFGGNVDMKYVLITGAGDDSLDWDMGWRGRVQFLLVQQYANSGDNGFEGDNNKASPDALPRSEPTLYNVTLISPRSRERFHRAMTIRHGSGGHFHNFIVQGFSGESFDIGGSRSAQLTDSGELTFANMLVHDIGTRGVSWFDDEQFERDDDGGFDERDFFMSTARRISFGVDPMLPREASTMHNPQYAPAIRSPARNNAVRPPYGEFWDEAADYLGAIKPGAMTAWTDGWTNFAVN